MDNLKMERRIVQVRTEEEMAASDAVDPFFQMFEAGIPLGDIFWKLDGIVIDPHPEDGYYKLFSSPISQLGIPEEILKEKGLLGY